MERENPDNEESYTETIKNYVVLPMVRGLSFGLAHVLAFAVLGPIIAKKLNLNS